MSERNQTGGLCVGQGKVASFASFVTSTHHDPKGVHLVNSPAEWSLQYRILGLTGPQIGYRR
jgi:hypothetical protein